MKKGKYTPKIVKKITDLIAADDYPIKEICNKVGIHEDTFYAWKNDERKDFAEQVEAAQERRLDTFRNAARVGMLALLQGKEYEETTIEYVDEKGKPKIKMQKTVKKYIPPNPTMVIFVSKNLDAENFADIAKHEHTGKNGQPIATDVNHTVIFKDYSNNDNPEEETPGS